MDIPAIYQYYPVVPLSDLSDVYSAGDNTLDGKKICIISYLPKTLRINKDFPFNNIYTLFLEDTATVISISWDYKLYRRGRVINDRSFIDLEDETTNRLVIKFRNDLFESNGNLKFDRLKVMCTVRKGAEEKTLTVEHNLVKMLDLRTAPLSSTLQTMAFAGDPNVANYVLNHLSDYFEKEVITWNNDIVDMDTDGENTLMKIVAAIIYHALSTSESHVVDPDNNLYDWRYYMNTQIEACLVDEAHPLDVYVNGICRLPLHVLSEVLTESEEIPDYGDINASNRVYAMIAHDPVLRVDSQEDDFLTVIPLKMTELRERIKEDPVRFKSLYNLSLFPKSAIKLTALLVKYLYACSQKNECLECKNRELAWQYLGLDDLKENQDFLHNILTHYFNGPANNIVNFSQKAVKCVDLVWTPTVHTMLNIAPRIVKAYFAKKIVKQLAPTDFVYEFEKIDSSMTRVNENDVVLPVQPTYDNVLGRELFLVVETLHCRGKELVINVRPETAGITGNTNDIEVLVGTNFVMDIRKQVGNSDALRDQNNNELSNATKRYFKIDHADKAVIKLSLKPQSRVAFDNWTTTLAANTENLQIKVRFNQLIEAYMGNNVTSRATEAVFLNATDPFDNTARFRVVNRKVYEMYHPQNNYRARIGNTANFVRAMGKIVNQFFDSIGFGSALLPSKKASYYYHDQIDNEHFFGDFLIELTPQWPVPNPPPVPAVHVPLTNVNQLNANEYNSRGVHIWFMILNSPRRWINPDRLAGLLGAMAANNIADLCYNGFSMQNGSAGNISVSHINGVNGDLRYLRTDFSGGFCWLSDAQFDYPRQEAFNISLHHFGWGRTTNMLSERFTWGGASTLLSHTTHLHTVLYEGARRPSRDVNLNTDDPQLITAGDFAGTEVHPGENEVTRHNHHLHLQGFRETEIEETNP